MALWARRTSFLDMQLRAGCGSYDNMLLHVEHETSLKILIPSIRLRTQSDHLSPTSLYILWKLNSKGGISAVTIRICVPDSAVCVCLNSNKCDDLYPDSRFLSHGPFILVYSPNVNLRLGFLCTRVSTQYAWHIRF